jgi:hypothetical protein
MNYIQKHNRKYVPGATNWIVNKNLRHSKDIDRHDYIESLVIDSGMLKKAPFSWIGLMYRYGFKNDLIPEYDKREIDPKDGEIAIAIELDMDILEWADKNNLKLFMEMMMIGALEALIHLGKKYKLQIDLIEAERLKFRKNIPETIEECKALPRMTLEDYPPIRKYFRNDINVCSNCFAAKATEKARQCLVCGEYNDPILIKENTN